MIKSFDFYVHTFLAVPFSKTDLLKAFIISKVTRNKNAILMNSACLAEMYGWVIM